MAEIINFPGVKNKQVKEQQMLIQICTNTVEAILQMPHWEAVTLQKQELEVLADFGETISFSPDVASKLISLLANQILKQTLEEDFICE